MNFETKLEDILRRYVPNNGCGSETYENLIKLLKIKIINLHEEDSGAEEK